MKWNEHVIWNILRNWKSMNQRWFWIKRIFYYSFIIDTENIITCNSRCVFFLNIAISLYVVVTVFTIESLFFVVVLSNYLDFCDLDWVSLSILLSSSFSMSLCFISCAGSILCYRSLNFYRQCNRYRYWSVSVSLPVWLSISAVAFILDVSLTVYWIFVTISRMEWSNVSLWLKFLDLPRQLELGLVACQQNVVSLSRASQLGLVRPLNSEPPEHSSYRSCSHHVWMWLPPSLFHLPSSPITPHPPQTAAILHFLLLPLLHRHHHSTPTTTPHPPSLLPPTHPHPSLPSFLSSSLSPPPFPPISLSRTHHSVTTTSPPSLLLSCVLRRGRRGSSPLAKSACLTSGGWLVESTTNCPTKFVLAAELVSLPQRSLANCRWPCHLCSRQTTLRPAAFFHSCFMRRHLQRRKVSVNSHVVTTILRCVQPLRAEKTQGLPWATRKVKEAVRMHFGTEGLFWRGGGTHVRTHIGSGLSQIGYLAARNEELRAFCACLCRGSFWRLPGHWWHRRQEEGREPAYDIDGLRCLPLRLRGRPTFGDIACARLASATAPRSWSHGSTWRWESTEELPADLVFNRTHSGRQSFKMLPARPGATSIASSTSGASTICSSILSDKTSLCRCSLPWIRLLWRLRTWGHRRRPRCHAFDCHGSGKGPCPKSLHIFAKSPLNFLS